MARHCSASIRFSTCFLLFMNYFSVVCSGNELKKCTKIDQCRCLTDQGEINLWSLAERSGKPRFPSFPSANPSVSNTFAWNPCVPWTLKDPCTDIAACKTSKVVDQPATYSNLGKQDSMECLLVNGSCVLRYKGHGLGPKSTTFFDITLKCDKEEKMEDVEFKVVDTPRYVTALHSKCACPGTCSESGLSAGSILLIIFFSIFLVYILVGILVNKYGRNIEGRQVLPNYSFWTDLPNLIKDGCVFTYQSCRNKCSSNRSDYASI